MREYQDPYIDYAHCNKYNMIATESARQQSRLQKNFDTNRNTANHLFNELSDYEFGRPAYAFIDDAAPNQAKYHTKFFLPINNPQTGEPIIDFESKKKLGMGIDGLVAGSNEVSVLNDGYIAYNMGHATGHRSRSNRHNKLRKAVRGLYAASSHPLSIPATIALEEYGGTPGKVISWLPDAVKIFEDGHAGFRGLRALKRIQGGKLKAANFKATLAALGADALEALGKHTLFPGIYDYVVH